MKSKIIRTLLGLPVAIALWPLAIVCAVAESIVLAGLWLVNGELPVWYEKNDINSDALALFLLPIWFVQRVWK